MPTILTAPPATDAMAVQRARLHAIAVTEGDRLADLDENDPERWGADPDALVNARMEDM